ncbi:hypothetical protein [Mycobacterium talmoniae]|uniref:hypothetical protein n=1 Tax=Mycobacterium talmoniae TaxID=1858794 RepID=UPI001058D362|nr:hypothetical protein [Mycobacterium talmoniae]
MSIENAKRTAPTTEHDDAQKGSIDRGLFENLAAIVARIKLRRGERIAARELLQTAKLKEETLMPLASTPEVTASLNTLYRESIATLTTLVERSAAPNGQ